VSAGPLAGIESSVRALALAIVPETRDLDESGWSSLERVVSAALSDRPPTMVRQFRIFVRAVMILPVVRYGRTFRGLSPDRQARVLRGLESSSSLLIRRGCWGIRTLVYMGYYSQPDVQRAIGYAATSEGWSAVRDRS
jgi:hypothetical protein